MAAEYRDARVTFPDTTRTRGTLTAFSPRIVDSEYLAALGLPFRPEPSTLNELRQGSASLLRRFAAGPPRPPAYVERRKPLDEPLVLRNYTGKCPTSAYEVNPVEHSCQVGCAYCLVNGGEHDARPGTLYVNYHECLRRWLARPATRPVFYYFSPRSEAFQEATLETGLAHKVLLEFIAHFRRNPRSLARVLVVSKAGIAQLRHSHSGTTVLELLEALKGRLQFNPSIGIGPRQVFDLLEPNAASAPDRLLAATTCQGLGVKADSVFAQPILLPCLGDEAMRAYLRLLADHGIINFKPEFLTVSPRNLAQIAQLLGAFDRAAERRLLELYLHPSNGDHVKGRGRLAPDRSACREALARLSACAREFGITTSICVWVRDQLQISDSFIPPINANGYRCPGFQASLFQEGA